MFGITSIGVLITRISRLAFVSGSESRIIRNPMSRPKWRTERIMNMHSVRSCAPPCAKWHGCPAYRFSWQSARTTLRTVAVLLSCLSAAGAQTVTRADTFNPGTFFANFTYSWTITPNPSDVFDDYEVWHATTPEWKNTLDLGTYAGTGAIGGTQPPTGIHVQFSLRGPNAGPVTGSIESKDNPGYVAGRLSFQLTLSGQPLNAPVVAAYLPLPGNDTVVAGSTLVAFSSGTFPPNVPIDLFQATSLPGFDAQIGFATTDAMGAAMIPLNRPLDDPLANELLVGLGGQLAYSVQILNGCVVGFIGDTTIAGGWTAFEAAAGRTMEVVASGAGEFSSVCSIPSSFGALGLSPCHEKRIVGSSWATWSHGYAGEIFWTVGATSATLTMPAGCGAYDCYIEPNPFSINTFTVTGTASDASTTTFNVTADGSGGASHFGFYTTGDCSLSSVTVTGAVDWAIGELRLGSGAPVEQSRVILTGTATEPGQVIIDFIRTGQSPPPTSGCEIMESCHR